MRRESHVPVPVALGGDDIDNAPPSWGKYLIVGGLVAAAAGLWMHRRRRDTLGLHLSGGFGKPTAALPPLVGTTQNGAYTLKHYAAKDMSIQSRVAILQGLVEDSVKDPEMRKLALSLTHKCAARDDGCEIRSVYEAIKKHVRYTGDVAPYQRRDGTVDGTDLFQSAKRTWEFRGGDCDDHSVMAATMLLLNGIPARFRITAPKGGDWQHIYTMAGTPRNNPSKWVAVDSTVPGDFFAKEASYGKHVDFTA